jgi:arginyl-tRNA synthetase
MIFYLDKIKNDLAKYLNVNSDDFVFPPNIDLGHLSLPLFNLAKKNKVEPIKLAEEKKLLLENSPDWLALIKEIKLVGPYLNIYFNHSVVINSILKNILSFKDTYGFYPSQGKLAMVEFANQNTHKDLHVGHLRNLSYGDSIAKLLKAAGRPTVAVSYINDQGINVAKVLWYLKKIGDYKKIKKEKGEILGKYYAEAVKKIEENEDIKKELSVIMTELEKKKGDHYNIWQETRQWSIDYFNQVYKELGIRLDKIFYESQMIERGLLIVKDLLAKNILTVSDKAVIADLRADNLEVMPIIRSDGTSLYPVADLALALVKFELYNLEESIYIIDVRQSLHFKQLFKILAKMGYQQKLTHLAYDFVKLKDGMMSSRSGRTVSYKQAFSQVYQKAKQETKKRRDDWSDKKINKVARDLTLSTLKFEMIKVAQDKIIVFDIDTALRFDGYTAAYLQYTGARINSLLNKGVNIFSYLNFIFKADSLTLDIELKLSLLLAQYPEKIKQAASNYNPAILARYLFDLCSVFNDYYQSTNILKADKSTKRARLALVIATRQVLKNSFKILGLKYLKKM